MIPLYINRAPQVFTRAVRAPNGKTVVKRSVSKSVEQSLGPTADVASAVQVLQGMAHGWVTSKQGRTAQVEGCEARMLYSDGKLYAVAHFDPLPPPATEPDAQPRRNRGAKV
jgi:hypothetical protein